MRRTDRRLQNEQGMALALVLFALVIIGLLVASTFLGGLLEQQSGRSLLLTSQAREAAEGELWNVVSTADPASLLSLPVLGEPLQLAATSATAGLSIEKRVARLADNLFLVLIRATRQDAAGGPLAVRSLGLLATLATDSISGAQMLLPIPRRPWLQLY
jgi:hypothetical protein